MCHRSVCWKTVRKSELCALHVLRMTLFFLSAGGVRTIFPPFSSSHAYLSFCSATERVYTIPEDTGVERNGEMEGTANSMIPSIFDHMALCAPVSLCKKLWGTHQPAAEPITTDGDICSPPSLVSFHQSQELISSIRFLLYMFKTRIFS